MINQDQPLGLQTEGRGRPMVAALSVAQAPDHRYPDKSGVVGAEVVVSQEVLWVVAPGAILSPGVVSPSSLAAKPVWGYRKRSRSPVLHFYCGELNDLA